jgi:hypothetical protein
MFIERIIRQTKITSELLINSFSEETLYFLPDSTLPIIISKNISITSDIESLCWSFTKNTFRYMEEVLPKKLPYLSVSLYKDGIFFHDLSEWFQNITVSSSINPPLRFLILTWAYQNKIVLDSYLTSKYVLHVITIDGDEIELDIKKI